MPKLMLTHTSLVELGLWLNLEKMLLISSKSASDQHGWAELALIVFHLALGWPSV